MGAWIETSEDGQPTENPLVAPRVGAWIETPNAGISDMATQSLPVWERGLKPFGV